MIASSDDGLYACMGTSLVAKGKSGVAQEMHTWDYVRRHYDVLVRKRVYIFPLGEGVR